MSTLPLSTDELAAKAREVAHQVGDHLSEHANLIRDNANTARYHAEDFIQNNPWPAIGLAAGIGFIFGVLVARR